MEFSADFQVNRFFKCDACTEVYFDHSGAGKYDWDELSSLIPFAGLQSLNHIRQ